MSDFLFSKANINQNQLTEAIHSIYQEDNRPEVKEFHGEWGSLGISKNLYYGFSPYENNQYLVGVIGGPILTFIDNSFLNDKDSSDGTKAIFTRWLEGKMDWSNDLSGPFVVLIINKLKGNITCVTDLMSFIPVFLQDNSNQIILSTHVDAMRKVNNKKNNLDKISLIDFILHGVVTYPYTIYMDVFQIAPASKHYIINNSSRIQSVSYWVPEEKKKYNSINEAATDLRLSLEDYINRITKETNNIAQFISGGEDSRSIAALLQNYQRDAYVFLDDMNREGLIAKKSSLVYGANFKLVKRDRLHYLNILPACSQLVGSGSQYQHAHTYGFHNYCNLNSYSGVFGGLFADALLKGSHIKKLKLSEKFPLIPEIKNTNYSSANILIDHVFKSEVLLELTKRRKSHLKYIQSFRKESAEEWFELWPSSMNKNLPNLHANRRLFRCYEPFMSKDIVKLCASVPQKWKLNRKLFHKAVKPLLLSTKWLVHSDGRLPYFSWWINSFLQFGTKVYRKVGIKLGWIKGNHGPWGKWSFVINSKKWQQKLNSYSKSLKILDDSLLVKDIFILNEKLTSDMRINLMQILYEVDSKHKL